MVASRHPSSRSVGTRPLDRIGTRPVPHRSEPGSTVGGCGGRRPRLRLVVDNTACRPAEVSPAAAGAMVGGGADGFESGVPRSLATELGAWLIASARLVEARWRLARQRWINRYGSLGLLHRIGGLAPVIGLVAVVLFGALFGLRLAQESSTASGSTADGSDGPDGSIASVAAVAASTPDPVLALEVGPPARSGSAVVVVHPGDSLWSIAVSRYPERDPREVVDAFVEANGASMIRSGQQLVVPAALLGD